MKNNRAIAEAILKECTVTMCKEVEQVLTKKHQFIKIQIDTTNWETYKGAM